jgi:hypothetical protein
VSIEGFAGLFPQRSAMSARLDGQLPGLYPRVSKGTVFAMRNGLYSLHMHMLDGVKGRDSGVIILRDGSLIGGGPYFWSIGSYAVGDGTWKGEFTTNQPRRCWIGSHARFPAARKSPAGFQGPLRMTERRCLAPPWWAPEAWAFAPP